MAIDLCLPLKKPTIQYHLIVYCTRSALHVQDHIHLHNKFCHLFNLKDSSNLNIKLCTSKIHLKIFENMVCMFIHTVSIIMRGAKTGGIRVTHNTDH